MREIKFRGLSEYGWSYGYLIVSHKDKAYIVYSVIDEGFIVVKRSQEVDIETVGQYVGVTDDWCLEMYEGDIVSYTHLTYLGNGNVGETTEILEISDMRELPFIGKGGDIEIKVIGNIYENPELLNSK